MQDRYHQLDEILLRRTAGPYIRVKCDGLATSSYASIAAQKQTLRHFAFTPNAADFRSDSMSASEYTLIFGLGPKSGGAPNTDVELAVALAAIEDASLKNCGGFTIHRGKGGW